MLIQYGALPFYLPRGGEPCFLLITSRDTGRWVVPRGNPINGLTPAETALQEAYEEAGLTGVIGSDPIGQYSYVKRRKRQSGLPAEVHLFPLQVTAQSSKWPEQHQRNTRWFSRERAAAAVDEAELKALIRRFEPLPDTASDEPLPPLAAPRRLWRLPRLRRR